MKTLAIIPARHGSKSVPNKNWREFAGGKSLAERALDIGLETCDEAWISTEKGTRETLRGHTLFRPESLATDTTPMLAVVQHAVESVKTSIGFVPDVVVLLQPTQPLRRKEHVIDALQLLERTKADSVVSVVKIPAHYSPDYALRINHPMIPGPRVEPYIPVREVYRAHYGQVLHPTHGLDAMAVCRQDASDAYSRDGTVYAIRRQTLERGSLYGANCQPLIIPSDESVNIDTEQDWAEAERRVQRKA